MISRTSGVPTVSVPVLSNRTVRASPSVSIAPAPLTITPARAARERPETSAIGAARISGHGVATTTTASARSGSPLIAQASPATRMRGRQEEPGVAIGHPHERRALRLRLLDQPHERRVRAVARRPVGADVERGARVCRSAQHGHPLPQRLGQRLAAERARVNDRLAADHGAVDRDDLAGAHQHHVAGLHPLDRDLFEVGRRPAAARPSARVARARSARGARGVEAIASSDAPPENISPITTPASSWPSASAPDHRDQRDRVDTEAVLDDDRAPDLDRQLSRQQRDRRPPHDLRRATLTDRVQQAADQPARQPRSTQGSELGARPARPGSLRADDLARWRATPERVEGPVRGRRSCRQACSESRTQHP